MRSDHADYGVAQEPATPEGDDMPEGQWAEAPKTPEDQPCPAPAASQHSECLFGHKEVSMLSDSDDSSPPADGLARIPLESLGHAWTHLINLDSLGLTGLT